jgi:VWFA-related protein
MKQMLARVGAPAPAKPDKKLKEELLKMANKQRELLVQMVEKDQSKQSEEEKLRKLYEGNTVRLCEVLKTHGWPTTALLDPDGMNAAFRVLIIGPFEMQRDLLPVIAATIKKDPAQKPDFAGLYDRLRVSAGMKQLFGTQAVTSGGFLVIYPVEDPAKLSARRIEFGLQPMDVYIKRLELIYGRPVIRARQPPSSQLSKQLTDSLTKAIDSAQLDGDEVDPDDVIKVETNLVSLNVSVFSSKAKMFVGSLAKEEFRVRENDQEQTVTYFASTHVPFDLVLLIDLSGSTADKRDLIRKSTQRFIEAARPTDRVAIVTFSDSVNVVSPLTLDRAQLLASVGKMQGTGGTCVWDAIKFVLDKLVGQKSLDRRRAVVLMSDGFDGSLMRLGSLAGSITTFADLLEQVRQTDSLIVPIYLDTEEENRFAKNDYENARRMLNLLAEESGGSYYYARKLADLNGVYEQVINDLGKVYSLGYTPTNATRDNSWRSVNVTIVSRPELVARARPGYYAQ